MAAWMPAVASTRAVAVGGGVDGRAHGRAQAGMPPGIPGFHVVRRPGGQDVGGGRERVREEPECDCDTEKGGPVGANGAVPAPPAQGVLDTCSYLPRREAVPCGRLRCLSQWYATRVCLCGQAIRSDPSRVGRLRCPVTALTTVCGGSAPAASAAGRALRVHEERVQRRAAAHEQPVAVRGRRSRRSRSARAGRCGRSSLPSGLKIDTPSRPSAPMPQPTQRLPSTSTRRPSGVPGPASIRRALAGRAACRARRRRRRGSSAASRPPRRRRASTRRARRPGRWAG